MDLTRTDDSLDEFTGIEISRRRPKSATNQTLKSLSSNDATYVQFILKLLFCSS